MDESLFLSEAMRIAHKHNVQVNFDLDARVVDFDIDLDAQKNPEFVEEIERLEHLFNNAK